VLPAVASLFILKPTEESRGEKIPVLQEGIIFDKTYYAFKHLRVIGIVLIVILWLT